MAAAKDLQGKTVPDLRAMAREAGLRGFSRMTKAELVAALSSGKAARTPKGTAGRKAAAARVRTTPPKRRGASAPAGKRRAVPGPETPPTPGPVRGSAHVPALSARVAPARPDEGLGPMPDGYGEDRIAVVPRDPEWAFIHWEVSEATWRMVWDRAGGGRATLRVVFEAEDGARDQSDADVHPRQGRFYARVPRPGCTVHAEVGILDGRGTFHAALRSPRVRSLWAGPRRGPVQFMTVPADAPLRDLRRGGDVVGRLLTEEEYLRLFGRGHPGSIPG